MKAAVYYETGAPERPALRGCPRSHARRRRCAGPGGGDQHRGRRHAQPSRRRHARDPPHRRLPVRRHDRGGGRRGDRPRRGPAGGVRDDARLARRAGRRAGRIFTWPMPDGLDLTLAACIPIAFGTADDCLFEFGRLQAGETVLVQAGAGGVGIAAIQLAKRAGATVLATASSDEKLARLDRSGSTTASTTGPTTSPPWPAASPRAAASTWWSTRSAPPSRAACDPWPTGAASPTSAMPAATPSRWTSPGSRPATSRSPACSSAPS